MSEEKHNVGETVQEVAEKAIEGLKHFGENVAQASKGFVTSGKLKSAMEDKQKEIDEAYKELGELAYQNGNLTGKMAEAADKIHKLYGELQEIELKWNDA